MKKLMPISSTLESENRMKSKALDCPFCNAAIAEEDAVCKDCGASVQKNTRRIAEIILIIIVSVIVGAFLGPLFGAIVLALGGVMIGKRIKSIRNKVEWCKDGIVRNRG